MSGGRKKVVVLGVTGASGITLAVHFLRMATSSDRIGKVHLVVSREAIRVGASEVDPPITTPSDVIDRSTLSDGARERIEIHSNDDVGASIASGSYRTDGMAIIPCSSGTLGSIANGISRGLVQRAADLTLKERRPLILALRETPFSLIHAENIVAVTRAGAIVMPPVPAFYAGQDWETYLDHFAMRVLDLLGVETDRPDLRWPDGGAARRESA